MFAGQSPRRRLLISSLVVVTALLAGGIVFAATRAGDAPASTPAGVVPVILVPGYGSSPASLFQLRDRLEASGRHVLIVTLPDRGEGDIVRSARVLAAVVRATGAPQVDLVGYSAGAIVVRTWLEELGGASRARRVVLLGAPNHGADLAAIALALLPSDCRGACAELAPQSTLLDRLNAAGLPRGPVVTSIWTSHDIVVVPPESAILPGALDIRLQSICVGDGVGHTGLPHDPLVFGLVLRVLAGELTTVPTPAYCRALQVLGEG